MFLAGICLFLSIVALVVLYPLIYIVSSSLSSGSAVSAGRVILWPVDFSLEGYKAVFSNFQILSGYGNSILYTAVGTFIQVALTVMLAYPLSHKGFYGRNVMTFLLVFTLLFEGGLIPLYLVVKEIGILNTRWAMLLPGAMAVWQMIIARTFFQSTIPAELREAAEMDGCSDFVFFWKVVLPLSPPLIAVLVLIYAVGNWNAYFDALIYLRDQSMFPLQLVLRNILILNSFDLSRMQNMDVRQLDQLQGLKNLLKYSVIVVASAPVLIIYPFVQKHFVKGAMVGSLKG